MKKIIQGKNSSENKSKGNVLDYIAKVKYDYNDGPKPRFVVREPFSMVNMIPKATERVRDKQKTMNRGSGTIDIAWELPHEMEEDVYGKYLELLKSGDLAPNTSFERFEKLYHDFGVDIISKKKRLNDQILSNAIAKIDNAMSGISGISSMGDGGSVKNKPREPKIKKLNLAQYFKLGMTIAELTPHERQLVNDLLKKTINPKSDN